MANHREQGRPRADLVAVPERHLARALAVDLRAVTAPQVAEQVAAVDLLHREMQGRELAVARDGEIRFGRAADEQRTVARDVRGLSGQGARDDPEDESGVLVFAHGRLHRTRRR
ncbi:hypothetical protein BE20_38825 [Sorangium cellulosum]|nr:hypothetical protein BE20_38825 [Sorangium cellulosum]